MASSGAWRGAGARVAARPLVALEPLLEGALAGVEVSVGAERERKAQQVDDEQDDRDFQAQGLLPHLGVSAGDHVEDRRHHQPHDREGEQRRAGARRDPVELLPLVFGPAGEGSDAFTMSCSPARRAASAMMSSAALPKVAFRSPPTPAPSPSEMSSVARPIQPASGTMAIADAAKTQTGSA